MNKLLFYFIINKTFIKLMKLNYYLIIKLNIEYKDNMRTCVFVIFFD